MLVHCVCDVELNNIFCCVVVSWTALTKAENGRRHYVLFWVNLPPQVHIKMKRHSVVILVTATLNSHAS